MKVKYKEPANYLPDDIYEKYFGKKKTASSKKHNTKKDIKRTDNVR